MNGTFVMKRKFTDTDSTRRNSSSSFQIHPLINSGFYGNNADDEYSSSNYSNSSSGDLSSDIHGYGSEPLLKIVRPPSYASVMMGYRLKDRRNRSFDESSSGSNQHNEYTYSPLSSIYSSLMAAGEPIARRTSIYGPTATRQERITFLGIISLMTFCGANNDFLGKLCYQSLPGVYSGYEGLYNRYWIAWLLTFGTFIVCSFAIIFGWDNGKEWKNFKMQQKQFMLNVSIPGNICIIYTVNFL